MRTRVVLIGGFNEARYLAASLIEKGYSVTAINENMDQCEELSKIDKLVVFNGDGSKPFVLEDAVVYEADIVIAMSPYDDANLVICELCKKKFNVKKTVALINDPKNTDFFRKMGVDSVVCSVSVLSNIIEQSAVFNNIKTIMPIGTGNIMVETIDIPSGAKISGKRLFEIPLPQAALIGCVTRGEQNIIPRGDTRIQEGDCLVVVLSEDDKREVHRILTEK